MQLAFDGMQFAFGGMQYAFDGMQHAFDGMQHAFAMALFPEKAIERLDVIGKWMKINGEAIYGVSPWRI